MSRVGDAWRALRGTVVEDEKQSATGPAVSAFTTGQPQRIKNDYAGFSVEGYGQNAALHKALSDIMTCVGSVPLLAFEVSRSASGDVTETRVPGHQLERTINAPNPVQDRSELMMEIVLHRYLAGEFFLESVNAEPGAKTELYELRPDRMSVIPGSDGLPQAYTFGAGGANTVNYPLDPVTHMGDVVHRMLPNPLNDWRGLSPIVAAAFGLDTHNAANKWNLTSLQQGARPPALLTIKGSNPETRREIRDELPEQISGVDNARKIMVIGAEAASFNLLSYSAVELDWIAGKFQSAREVCWAVGYPSFLLGMPGDATFNNQADARLGLWDQTVIPILNSIVNTLNTWLAPRLDPRRTVILKPDFENVSALAPRREALWARLQASTWLTVNERRAATGLSPLDDPAADEVFISSSLLPLGLSSELPGADGETEGALTGAAQEGEAGAGDAVDSSVALNGIQIRVMQDILNAMLSGELPYERAIALMQAGLGLSREGAIAVLGPTSGFGSQADDDAAA